MRMDTKLFDDMARLAASAMGTVAGMREEMEAQFRQQVERILSRMDVVSREEHEAARDMAAAAREQQPNWRLPRGRNAPGQPRRRRPRRRRSANPRPSGPRQKTSRPMALRDIAKFTDWSSKRD